MANSTDELLSAAKVENDLVTADDLSLVVDDNEFVDEGTKRNFELSTGDDLIVLNNNENTAKRQKLNEQARKINNEQWEAMFERLVTYKEKFGDCLVPKRYSDDPKLGTWVETQRVQYKRLERSHNEGSGLETVVPNKRLNQERLEKLQAIGFAWTAKNVRNNVTASIAVKQPASLGRPKDMVIDETARSRVNDNHWEHMFQCLVKYKEKHGNCLVPRKYEPDQKLATWVETQRVLWNRDYRSQSQLGDSNSNNGDFPNLFFVPRTPFRPFGHLGEETPHDGWNEDIIKEQQGIVEATEEDAAEVTATMGEETTIDEGQNEAVAAAVAAVAAESLEGITLEEQDNMQLDLSSKRLSQERKDRLDELGFVWSLRNKRIDDHWDEMFQQLVAYKQQHGDCLVPSRYEVNVKLGKWVETQRYEYTKLQRTANGVVDTTEEVLALDGQGKVRCTNPRLTEERICRLESIGFEWKVKHKMKRYYDKQWEQMFERLLQFRSANGHCMVPKRYQQDMKLGTWVHTQRIQYRKMMTGKNSTDGTDTGGEEVKSEDEQFFRLTDERRKRLEEIGFVWSARESEKGNEQSRITRNSYDDQWDEMFNRLKCYKEKHGDCLVPKRYKEEPKLGTWVDTQRVQYKKMRKKLASEGVMYEGPLETNDSLESHCTPAVSDKPVIGRLTDDRIRRLEKLGFVWSLRDDWQKHFDELKEFKKENGHCNVPARYTKNRRLGIWVSAQRQQFKNLQLSDSSKLKRSARLTPDRICELNELGFTWTIRSRDSLGDLWNQRLQDLKDFKREHGHCNVPSRYEPNLELGVWVGTQRTQYRLFTKAKEANEFNLAVTSIDKDRIQQLEELGFVWTLRNGDIKKESVDTVDQELSTNQDIANDNRRISYTRKALGDSEVMSYSKMEHGEATVSRHDMDCASI